MRYGFVIDQTRCIGCHACTVACKAEHNVPVGVFRTWVQYVERGRFPDTSRHFAVLRCNHCDNAPCTTICPTRALYRRADGIVDFDNSRCIGCKACMQACPYDAIYLDPNTHTAAKCNYCAHRTERGLEPACVVVCPVNAIIPGDLDDPESRIAQIVGRQKVAVRKPEQGTRPKLFYVGVDEIALQPGALRDDGAYLWAERPAAAPIPIQPAPSAYGTAAGAVGRKVYDVTHAKPWGWKVAAYLWTKGVGAGAALVAAFLLAFGLLPRSWLLDGAAPALAVVFTALTAGLLVWDLKRPERFLYLLLKPNPGSWLVRGAWCLIAFGGFAGLWFLLNLAGARGALPVFWWLSGLSAIAAAGYTGFLFGQAEGRDLWQSTLFLPHLIAAAVAGGAALLIIAALLGGEGRETLLPLARALALGALATGLLALAEAVSRHATADAARAAHELAFGRFRRWFWLGAVLCGAALPLLAALLYLSAGAAGALLAIGALAALAGLAAFEWAWVEAGQVVPLS
ncbi:MAG TPA: 4Fe-4S dicluster domain-containing protein [Dehalococcoidia bacterium]|nr:4Fe-4S dicluster domain-containing protein [Dehalococcoidia bacterium]